MRAADYFCGAGGASQGLHEAGYDVVGFDHWQTAVDTHNANGISAHLRDLSDPEQDGTSHLGAELAWFSPPCQPFSAAGDGEGEFDGRDGFPWALRILARTLPAVAIFENVKGVTFEKHRGYFAGILQAIRDLGYRLDWNVLNCADYGVPQTRERCIIIARRDNGPIVWPTVTHTEQAGMFTDKWVSMADALGWRCRSTVTLHSRQNNRDGDEITFDVTNRPAPTVGTKVESQWWLERPDATIAGDTRVFQPGGHHQPGEQSQNAIRLTIPELARLQDFPDDWVWCGTKTDQARQVGNAVPRTLARLLAEANRPVLVTQ